ncbi:hypothetical protein KOR42_40400 [Thalassoglobus neptunius]|uniref:Uncharacterized protein n=1 Tax=Thalassoglobus neptunius TaxID=1938619 RepID=A0A5C5WAM1_9PLAN|nr:hypothetical protein KOR42_40400 [Thalassoglobus neptunius]
MLLEPRLESSITVVFNQNRPSGFSIRSACFGFIVVVRSIQPFLKGPKDSSATKVSQSFCLSITEKALKHEACQSRRLIPACFSKSLSSKCLGDSKNLRTRFRNDKLLHILHVWKRQFVIPATTSCPSGLWDSLQNSVNRSHLPSSEKPSRDSSPGPMGFPLQYLDHSTWLELAAFDYVSGSELQLGPVEHGFMLIHESIKKTRPAIACWP